MHYGSMMTKAISNNSVLVIEVYWLLEIPQAMPHLLTNIYSKKFNPPSFKSCLPEISFTSCMKVVPSTRTCLNWGMSWKALILLRNLIWEITGLVGRRSRGCFCRNPIRWTFAWTCRGSYAIRLRRFNRYR